MASRAHSLGAMLTLAACALFVCGWGAAARAEPPEVPPAAPASVQASLDYTGLSATDPLDRARAVARLGDGPVLALLSEQGRGTGHEAALRLAAIESAAFLRNPAEALAPLVPLMQGRDPDLAPAAAQAIVAIARRLVEASRAPEGVSAAQLAALAKQLRAIEQDPRVRADLKLAAVQAATLLDAACERL